MSIKSLFIFSNHCPSLFFSNKGFIFLSHLLRVCAGEIQTVWCTDFSSMLFFGLIWWKVAKKWLLTHPQGIWTWKWGRFGLYSKTWILRPDCWGSAFSSFPCLPVGGKFLFLHQGDLLIPLEYPIEEKKNFLVKTSFSDFFKKIRIFPPTDGETPEIGNFHKRPKNF